MKRSRMSALAVLFALAGCSHALMRGTVAMKVSDEEAHVCMGDNEVKAGDKVTLYKNVCTPTRMAGREADGSAACKKVRSGEGFVERTFNEHYSLVKVDPGVQFEEGTVVEKR